MRLLRTKLDNVAPTITTILPILSPLCLILRVRLGDVIMNPCDFSFYGETHGSRGTTTGIDYDAIDDFEDESATHTR